MACGFGTLKHVVALFSLHFVSPQAWIYAFAFACVACLEVLVNAINVRRVVSTTEQRSTNNKIPLVPLLKEVSLLSVGILVGLLVSQLDRIVLSRSVDVASFGVYTVIATLALAFLQLQAPITRACFPLIVESVQNGEKLSNVHMKYLLGGTFLTCTLPALLACTVAQTILEIWLNDVSLVSLGATPLKLLLLGIALNSIYGCFYQFIIATGQSHRVLQFNSLSLAVAVVAIYTYGIDNGLLLGAIIWLSTSSTQLLLGIIWWYTTSYRKAQP
jgi:O-antigen/teichoic acid export membrane protein